jgi:cytoskeletal protein CcmA (bactofilin family)
MAQVDIHPETPESAASTEEHGKLRFVGTVQVGGTVSGQMLSVLFGTESNVDGTLQFDGALQIDGTFRGAIKTSDVLVVGERAEIAANVTCGSAVVSGQVVGNITASDSVELRSGAHVKGDIQAPALSVERGAIFEGSSRMGTLPARPRRTKG